MSYPENPNTVVIQNQYYPGGLTELKIWKHYQKFKNRIISEIDKSAVAIWIFSEMNNPIVKRKVLNRPFTITKDNYDKIMTGRTVSISSELKNTTNNIIIDIDPGKSVTELQVKECVRNILDSSVSKLSYVNRRRIISTAKGYHVHLILDKKMNINSIRTISLRLLSMDFRDTYLVNSKNPKPNEINLDTTPIYQRGLHQVPYALCRNGLVAMDVTDYLSGFNRRSATIK